MAFHPIEQQDIDLTIPKMPRDDQRRLEWLGYVQDASKLLKEVYLYEFNNHLAEITWDGKKLSCKLYEFDLDTKNQIIVYKEERSNTVAEAHLNMKRFIRSCKKKNS